MIFQIEISDLILPGQILPQGPWGLAVCKWRTGSQQHQSSQCGSHVSCCNFMGPFPLCASWGRQMIMGWSAMQSSPQEVSLHCRPWGIGGSHLPQAVQGMYLICELAGFILTWGKIQNLAQEMWAWFQGLAPLRLMDRYGRNVFVGRN